MRCGEVRNLTWDKVDRKTGFIRLKVHDTKTSRSRRIPIAPELDEALRTLPRSLKNNLVFTRNGEQLAKHFQNPHTKICEDAGIEDFRIHDFRHTCIQNWVDRAKPNIFTLQAATGHKDIRQLARYYQVTDEGLKEMVTRSSTVRFQSANDVTA